MSELVVTSCDTQTVFETAKHSLDEIRLFADLLVKGKKTLSICVVWDDGSGSPLDRKGS